MKRSPIALLPWMVLATVSHAQTRSADVVYTHHDEVPTRAYRVGDEAFVALEDVDRWGWKATHWADTVDIKAEGKSFSLPLRVVSGRQTFPLRAALKKLGGGSEWVNNTDTLSVYGLVTSVKVRDGKVQIDASLEFQPRTTVLTDPARLVIDLTGVRIDPATKLDLGAGSRMVQYKPNVARLIVETPALVDLDKLNAEATRSLQTEYPTEAPAPPKQAALPVEPPDQEPPTPPVVVPQATSKLDIQVDGETDTELRLTIANLPKGDPTFQKPDVDTLEVVLPGVNADLDLDFRLTSDSITSVTSHRSATGTIVTLALARPMGAQVTKDAKGVHLQLLKPNVGDGRLAGKLIVVDPGHGGKDRGANAGGVFEKDLNLIMGKLIADELARAGATVIMTRKTDVFISLNARAQLAEKVHADLFVSSHINSTGGSGSQSGGITFHHLGRPVSRVLAECIQQEIAKVSGIPNLGAWSDGRIYRTGFAVLRQTTMPGVLLELGFINHPRDRKRLVTDDFQQSVAKAVVRGIKVFLGDAKKND